MEELYFDVLSAFPFIESLSVLFIQKKQFTHHKCAINVGLSLNNRQLTPQQTKSITCF